MTISLSAVTRLLGLLVLIFSGMILLVAGFSALEIFRDAGPAISEGPALRALLLASGVGVVFGGLLTLLSRNDKGHFGQREALLLVSTGWLIGAGLGALPYRFWAFFRPDAGTAKHNFDSSVNCFFEAMSGLTTTGATILEAIGTVPRSLLLWRSMTHWLGGLGIVVLFVAVLPGLGVGGRRVFRIETPGPSPEGVRPRIQDTARILWLIYLGLTSIEVLALKLCGMSWFDSVCHTLATLATGGFSTLDSSVAGFASSAIHLVIVVFMILAGVNFSLYFELLRGRWRGIFKNAELRVYLGLMLAATVVITVNLVMNRPPPGGEVEAASFGVTVRDSLFQVVAIQTTTGFGTADFNEWPSLSKAVLMMLMFVGGCAGSTGGGIKVIRIMIAAKVLLAEVEHAFRPHVVRSLKVGQTTIDADQKLSCMTYVLGVLMLFAAGTIALLVLESHQGIDLTTASTAAAATLNNIGPGLAMVGPTHNYAWFSEPSKLVMCGLMALGRLEVLAIIVMFSPRFWREE